MVIYEQGKYSWHYFFIRLVNVTLDILLDEDPNKCAYEPYNDRKTPTLIIDLVKRR